MPFLFPSKREELNSRHGCELHSGILSRFDFFLVVDQRLFRRRWHPSERSIVEMKSIGLIVRFEFELIDVPSEKHSTVSIVESQVETLTRHPVSPAWRSSTRFQHVERHVEESEPGMEGGRKGERRVSRLYLCTQECDNVEVVGRVDLQRLDRFDELINDGFVAAS